MRLSLAMAVLGLSLFLSAPVSGQPAANPATDGALYTLRARGKVGDRVALTARGHMKMSTTTNVAAGSGQPQETHEEEENNQEGKSILVVGELTPGGGMKLRQHVFAHDETTIKNGKRSVKHFETTDSTPSVDALGSKSDAPKVHTASGGGPAQMIDSTLIYLQLPEKPVRVGDTWSGALFVNANDKDVPDGIPYTAKLVGIERVDDTPCAKVEFVPSFEKVMRHFMDPGVKQISKALGPDGKIDMTPTDAATMTVYFSLDRGIALSFAMDWRYTMTCVADGKASDTPLHLDMKVALQLTLDSKCINHPPYDPALVSKTADPAAAGAAR